MSELVPIDDDTSIGAALHRVVDRFDPSAIVHIDDRLPADTPRPSLVIAYQIAREALVNAIVHASAASVTVTTSCADGQINISVTDDGLGFDPSTSEGRVGHLGLFTMTQRAIEAGGTIDLFSSPGCGTTLTASLPVSSTIDLTRDEPPIQPSRRATSPSSASS